MVQTTEERTPQDELRSYFDKSASQVRVYADHFEQTYARPAIKTSTSFFNEYPLSTTFIAIFSLFSFIPVAVFIGLSLFTVVSFALIALTSAFVASSVVVLSLLSILISILLAVSFISALLTVVTISAYFMFRLAILVRANGPSGVSDWAVETRGRFSSSRPTKSDFHDKLNASDAIRDSEYSDENLPAAAGSEGVKLE